jgi:hypothetical protein
MISCSAVEFTSVTSKPGKEKGSACKKKLLMKPYILSAFLYELERQWLSTTSAGDPVKREEGWGVEDEEVTKTNCHTGQTN